MKVKIYTNDRVGRFGIIRYLSVVETNKILLT